MRLLLLLIVAAAVSVRGAEWQLEVSPLETKNTERTTLRVDVTGGVADEHIVEAIMCVGRHLPQRAPLGCESPGMFRKRLPLERTLVVPLAPLLYTLVDLRISNGERCVKALSPMGDDPKGEKDAKIAAADAAALNKEQKPVPWYYYTVVILAACVIGVALLSVVAGSLFGGKGPFSASLIAGYKSRRNYNRKLAAESLGLFQAEQPMMISIDDD